MMPPPGRAERLLARRGRAAVRRLLPTLDFLHLHGVWEPLLKAAAQEAHAAGVPYCFVPSGMLDPWSLSQRRWKKKLALALGYRRALDRAAFLHALNEDEARLIEPLGLRPPCAIIPNGIFPQELEPRPMPGAFRAAHPQLAGRRYIVFVSRLHHKKGLDLLAEAFGRIAEQLPDVDLVVVGPDDGARGPFESAIAGAGLAGRVLLPGPLYGRDKFAALAEAACFCLPSRQEGFSVAILEALAMGIPVVITHACHFPEVERAGAGVLTSLESPDIAAGLLRVLTDTTGAAEMGRRGRELVASRYTWPAVAGICLEAYGRHAAPARRNSLRQSEAGAGGG
jgi:glycosyltransferase involved in cell wall biosynthesis